jgi:hypothetical protein
MENLSSFGGRYAKWKMEKPGRYRSGFLIHLRYGHRWRKRLLLFKLPSMKILLSFLLLAFTLTATAQEFTAPRLTKTAIGESGCHAYLPPGSETFDVSNSEDGSTLYTGDFLVDEYSYGLIVVKLSQDAQIATQEDKEALLTSYMDYLQVTFAITSSVGYGKGHTLEKYPEATGVLDYWIDEDATEWVVKGWCDGKTLAIMMLYGPGAYPSYNVQNMFLDGFRFD